MTDMNEREVFLLESDCDATLLLLVGSAGKNAALFCAESHLCAIRWAASSALSTSAWEGEDRGVWARRSYKSE
jgi:hypothetical protein